MTIRDYSYEKTMLSFHFRNILDILEMNKNLESVTIQEFTFDTIQKDKKILTSVT